MDVNRYCKQTKSIVFLKPAAVRHYLENSSECRRIQLLQHFDPKTLFPHDPLTCCDVCMQAVLNGRE